jgi:hypothetical protein
MMHVDPHLRCSAGRARPEPSSVLPKTDRHWRRRRYYVQPHSLRAVGALLTLRDHVIAPILAGVRSPHLGRKPTTWTAADRHYEQLPIRMQPLFHDLGIAA